MPVDLVWTPKALEDVQDIYVRIGLAQPQAADRFFDSFERKAKLLIDQPRLGIRRPEIAQSARMVVEAPFLILYETIPDSDEGQVAKIRIVRVVDGRRELKSVW